MRPTIENEYQEEKLKIFISKIIELIQLDNLGSFNQDSYRLINSCENIALEEVRKIIDRGATSPAYYGSGTEIVSRVQIINQDKDYIHGKVLYRKYLYYQNKMESKDNEFEFVVRKLTDSESKMFLQAIANAREIGEKIIVPLGVMFGYKLANYEIKEL